MTNSRFSDHPFAAGRVLAGRFRIVRQLGFGGMGAVFEVEHEITCHRRALKLLHPQMADVPAIVERFLREASAAGRIGNRHIVETFDAGRLETGEPYIVMELLEGRTLADVLHRGGPLALDRAIDLLIQACDGVGAAHAAGIVHRDLKPENLFLTEPNESFVKILDFGISKFDAAITGIEGLTLEGSPMGTPYYMSPEQVRGQKSVDGRADVYALGVVFYECLTARRPFDAGTLPELILRIAHGEYVAPSQLRPELPPVTDDVVRKALAQDPLQRFASTEDFSQAILALKNSPKRTEVLLAITAGAPAPRAIEHTHVLTAMTPGVFSRTSVPPIMAPMRPSWSARTWIVLSAALLAVAALGIGLWANGKAHTSPMASGAAQLPYSSDIPAPTNLAQGSRPLAGEVPITSTSASAAPAPAASTALSRRFTARPRPSAGEHPSANSHPEAASSATVPIGRAASQGLAQDNPFK